MGPHRSEPSGTSLEDTVDTRTDAALVAKCLAGDESAWAVLIERYKRLIYSIPRSYGASPEDAADVFQAVCVELFSQLPKLRKAESIRSWLATVATHQSFHWKRRAQKRTHREGTELDERVAGGVEDADAIGDVERAHMLQEGLARLSPRCQEMVRHLFFTDPPLPYAELAERLGLATGSIGFIRGRCLTRLKAELERMGF